MRLLTSVAMLVPKCRALALSTLLAGSASSQAGFFSSNFDAGQPPELMTFGSAYIDPAAGVGGSGALRLTDAFNDQMGTVVLTDLDSQPTTGFTASFNLLIGGGSGADGLSFNAGTSFFGQLFGEEGTPSALTISFDTYDNGGGEAPAIDIRQWGSTIFSLKGNGDLFRTGDFIDVVLHADNDGTLDLTVNGVPIVSDLPAAFPQSWGPFAFGARTGGLNDNHIIDDLTITTITEPSPTPTLVQISPRMSGTHPEAGIYAALLDGSSTQIDLSSIELRLNGQVVPATVFYTNIFAIVMYDPPGPLASGADYTVSLKVGDTGSPAVTKTFTWDFQVTPYRGPNGHLYELVWTPWGVTWDQAKLEAESRTFMGRRGHLVTITSADEDAFVELVRRRSFPDQGITEVWAGGFQQPGLSSGEGWSWVNDEGAIPGSISEPGYSNWLINEPNDFQGPDSENYLSLGLFGQFGWNDTGYFGFGTLFGYIVEYDSLPIAIDVKPADPSNTIQLKSSGKIPVAIFGSSEVNVSSINITSLRAGRTGIEAAVVSSSISDLNADGHADLVANFNLQDLELACGDMQLHLTGQLSEGSTIRGSDQLNLLGCPPYSLAIAALQDVEGRTELKLNVNTILPGFLPPTNGTHLQLKSYNLAGNLSWTKNIQPVPLVWNSPGMTLGSVWLADALHLQPIRAKFQVPNSNNGSTENIYAETRVLNRPDLSVHEVSAPSQVNVRQLFNVVAEIRELKGDLGGSGVAYLLEDGVVLDLAPLAVEPGGNAGVVFSVRLATEGTHQLTVQVANSDLDYDPSNNEKSIALEALRPEFEPVFTEIQYQNSYSETSYVEENEFHIHRYFSSFRSENFYQTLYIPAPLSFPVSLASLRVWVDGSESFLADVEIPYFFTDIFGCFQNDFGYVFFDDGLTLNAQTVTDCSGFQQSYVIASRFSYDQVYYSALTPKDGGDPSEYSYQDGTGVPWSATQNITTRFLVQDESGTFGGTAGADVFNVYDYFNPFNYEVDGTTVIGYDQGRYDAAYFGGFTEP